MNTKHRAAPIFAAIAMSASLAGCASSTPVAEVRCDQPPVITAETPRIAILAQPSDDAGYYERDLASVVDYSVESQAHVLVSGIGSEAGSPNLAANLVAVGEGVNNLERDQDLACKEDLVQGAVAEITATPARDGADVFGALMSLQGNLEGSQGPAGVDVVVFGSLLNTAAPVDLSAPAVLGSPEAALNTLASNRLIPSCEGWRMYAVAPASGSAADNAALREFWRQYMERCGGRLVAWTPHLVGFPGDGQALAAADTTQIQVETRGEEVLATLGGDVLFDTGSARLRGNATASLEQLLELANSMPGPITITGHTDARGSEADNLRLSRDRAESVAAWLIDHGIDPSRISADGVGEA